MGFGVLFEIKTEQTFVEEEVSLSEDISFLDAEALSWQYFPHRLTIAFGCPIAGLLQSRKTAVIKP